MPSDTISPYLRYRNAAFSRQFIAAVALGLACFGWMTLFLTMLGRETCR